MILPDRTFFSAWITDARLRRLSPQVQLLLIFIRPLCDRYGRFEVNPALIHMALYKSANCGNVSVRDVESWLEILRSGGFIKTYVGTDGRRIGEVAKEYWRQKLSFGKAVYESENGEAPLLDLADTAPPPPPNREEKRRETCAVGAAPADAGAKAESFSDFSNPRATARSQAPSPAPATESESAPYAPTGADIRYDLGYRTRAQIEEPLFLALCRAEGSDPALLTPAGKRSLTVALGQLRRAQSGLTVEDIERAAVAYRKKFPTADLTAFALAKHWARLPIRTTAHQPLVEPEPLGWRDWVNENTPDVDYARGGEKEGTPWEDLPAHYRRYLLDQCAKRAASAA